MKLLKFLSIFAEEFRWNVQTSKRVKTSFFVKLHQLKIHKVFATSHIIEWICDRKQARNFPDKIASTSQIKQTFCCCLHKHIDSTFISRARFSLAKFVEFCKSRKCCLIATELPKEFRGGEKIYLVEVRLAHIRFCANRNVSRNRNHTHTTS